MAAKGKTTAAKPKAAPGRGGPRAGSGRKPKAIVAMRDALIVPMVEASPIANVKSAAEYALCLFETTMRDDGKDLDLRLDCAREVLNRTIGRPRVAEEPAVASVADDGVGGICIYMPDNGRKPQAEAV